MSMNDVTIECPDCGDRMPIPTEMVRYDWKHDAYSRATRERHCWNCGYKVNVRVRREIVKAEVVK